ncbi:MAG: hypothetical protein V2B20_03125 [Pseudomonadota bacterium]
MSKISSPETGIICHSQDEASSISHATGRCLECAMNVGTGDNDALLTWTAPLPIDKARRDRHEKREVDR